MRAAVTLLAAALLAAPAVGQHSSDSVVTIYRAAPGHQEALLRLMARQDQIYRAVGMPAAQLYVHESGDTWDFVTVAPKPSAAQEAAIAAAAKRLRAPSGPRAALELRQHLAEHSDTIALGPTTATEVLRKLADE